MKIVFWAPFGIRPKGTLLARMLPLASELRKLGHETVIVAPPYTNPEDSGKVEEVQGVKIRNISLGPKSAALAAPVLALRMFRAAMEEKPDLIHLFKPKGYGGLAAIGHLLAGRLGRPLPPLFIDTDDWEGRGGMETLHPYPPAQRLLFRFQEGWLLPRAAGVTVASRTLQTQSWGLGIPPGNVLYLPNGVGIAPRGNGAAARQKLGIAADAPVVLLYTRFFEFSQEKLHRVFAEISRNVPAVRFLVVGRGRQGEERLLVEAGEAMGFAPALALAGWADPSEIPDYLAAGDVAVYPFSDTLVNRAKCPAKVTELLRAGVAVVADNVGQLSEYIRPGDSGVLCDPEEWEEMARQTTELLRNPEKRSALAHAGRDYLLRRFHWKDAAVRLAGFYRERIPGSDR